MNRSLIIPKRWTAMQANALSQKELESYLWGAAMSSFDRSVGFLFHEMGNEHLQIEQRQKPFNTGRLW